MDTALLSKMVTELVLDHSQVGLPGIGTFFADVVPASFSDRGYTINPPYRRLTFIPGKGEDDLLIDLYAKSNSLKNETAKVIMNAYLADLRKELSEKKIIELEGLGRLRATRQNSFFFVADPDLDIFPEGIGLESVSLRTRDWVKPSAAIDDTVGAVEVPAAADAWLHSGDVDCVDPTLTGPPSYVAAGAVEVPAAAVARLHSGDVGCADPTLSGPPSYVAEGGTVSGVDLATRCSGTVSGVDLATQCSGTVSGEDLATQCSGTASAVEPGSSSDETVETGKRRRWWWITPLVVVAVLAIALALFLILAKVAPDFIDSLLYTPEELRIINY